LCSYASTLVNGFGSGCCILGRKGTLEYEKGWRISPDGVERAKEKIEAASTIKPKAGYVGNMDIIHMRNWLECVRRGDRQTHCTAEHGYQHAVACILADRALHSGQRMVFDEKTRTIREG